MLQDKVALVTGSSSGIGEATARRLAAAGAKVVVNSSSSVEAGTAVAESLPEAVYIQADISDHAQVEAMVAKALDAFGRLDIVVNNAGTTQLIPHADLETASPEVFERILMTNVVGSYSVTRAAAAALKASGAGCVVYVTSVAGLRTAGSSVPYAVSKAALHHLTRLQANVLGPEIRVNAVAPGLVRTPWTERFPNAEDHFAGYAQMAPMKRTPDPEDIAEAVYALTQLPAVTGEIIAVDGGLHLLSVPQMAKPS